MASLFISYSSKDRDGVARLANALEKSGIDLWWDRRLAAGDAYEEAIGAALNEAKVVVVVWSQSSVASQWVRAEADFARRRNILVPVLLEPCEAPLPFDRLHTADLTGWRGDPGNQGFPELLEAIQSRIEGRAPRPIRWRRRITIAAVGSALATTIALVAGLTGIADAAIRFTQRDQFAAGAAGQLAPAGASAETQEGFKAVLKELSTSLDRRTQTALTTLQSGSRSEAISGLLSIATDQSTALGAQLERAATLWRQIGLLLYNDDPVQAIVALEKARRFNPDDTATLLPLAALYHRSGRDKDAEAIYASLTVQALSPSDKALANQVIAQALLDRGEIGQAQELLLATRRSAEADGNDRLVSDLTIDIGRVAFERMDLEAAYDSFMEAENFAEAIPYDRSALYARLNRVETLIALDRLDKASDLLAKAKDAAEQQADRVIPILLNLSAARIAIRNGDTESGRILADRISAEARTSALRDAELQADLLSAEALMRTSRPSEAKRKANSVAAAWRSFGNAASASVAEALSLAVDATIVTTSSDACARLAALARSPPTPYARSEMRRFGALAHCPDLSFTDLPYKPPDLP